MPEGLSKNLRSSRAIFALIRTQSQPCDLLGDKSRSEHITAAQTAQFRENIAVVNFRGPIKKPAKVPHSKQSNAPSDYFVRGSLRANGITRTAPARRGPAPFHGVD
jgi:hypothetical protein